MWWSEVRRCGSGGRRCGGGGRRCGGGRVEDVVVGG